MFRQEWWGLEPHKPLCHPTPGYEARLSTSWEAVLHPEVRQKQWAGWGHVAPGKKNLSVGGRWQRQNQAGDFECCRGGTPPHCFGAQCCPYMFPTPHKGRSMPDLDWAACWIQGSKRKVRECNCITTNIRCFQMRWNWELDSLAVPWKCVLHTH